MNMFSKELRELDRNTVQYMIDEMQEELEGKTVFLWTESKESGKRRIFQGVWQQQDANGLYSVLYDSSLEPTDRVRFMIPNLSYPLDDRYEVHIMIRDGDKGYKLMTDNLLYDRSTGV